MLAFILHWGVKIETMKNLSLVLFTILCAHCSVISQYILTPTKLPSSIYNSEYEHHMEPMISSDGSMLVYSGRSPDRYNYYWTKRTGDSWSTPTKIEILKNIDTEFLLNGFNGKSLFFYTPSTVEGTSNFKILKSDFKNEEFSVPVPIEFPNLDIDKRYYDFYFGNPNKIFFADKISSEKNQKVYETYFNGTEWSGPVELPKELVGEGIWNIIPIGNNGILFKKQKIRKSKTLNFFISIKENETWSIPVKLTMDGFTAGKKLDRFRMSSYSAVTNELYFTHDYKNDSIYSAKLPEKIFKLISTEYPDLRTPIVKSIVTNEAIIQKAEKPKYYAILLAIDNYRNNSASLMDLNNPISDANNLKKYLITNYSFKEENVHLLKNPQRSEIINLFEKMADVLSEKDNFLIFYAGHGVWDDKLNIGYWLSSDATVESKTNWISNSTIREYIAGLNTKHTLLISDACFSGSIFKAREINKTIDDYGYYRLNKLPSRKAMTSGTLKTVPDTSMFMKYLLKTLAQNEQEYLPSRQLFYEIYTAVINNTNNTNNVPQFGTIQNTGDEGGDFIFIKSQ